MSHLSCPVGMGGIRELLDGKIWEWDLSFRWEWKWDGNGNEVIKMGGNWYKKSVPAHLYLTPFHSSALPPLLFCITLTLQGGSVAEWLACWTQAQKGPGSNRSRDAVG